MGLFEFIPTCDKCFWFKIDWENNTCKCTHPQHPMDIPVDEATEKTFCDGKDWVERGDSALPFGSD